MRLFCKAIFILFFLSSCSILSNLNKLQSDKKFKKTENANFSGNKAKTQWWYFDCFLEDGSILVFLFTPHEWWNEEQPLSKGRSLFYISYMYPDGKVKSVSKVFDFSQLSYDEKKIECPYFKISKSHTKNSRNYLIDFYLDEIKGSANIRSVSKGFSPLPTGSMGKFATRHILKLKGKNLAFRYAAHVPQGEISCELEIDQRPVVQKGKVYHEQGRFTGSPEQMGKGWTWFHFVSKNVNIFGKPGDFLCIEKEHKRLIAGIGFKKTVLLDKVYSQDPTTYLMGGKLQFKSNKVSFEISPTGRPSTPLILIRSFDTHQLWGTVAQPSILKLNDKGKELVEEGMLLLETCKMGKIR